MNFPIFSKKTEKEMLRTVIVDDEGHVRATLGKFLAKFCPECTVDGEAGSAKEAYEVIRQVTVADVAPAICDAVRGALGRADVVITTGGTGVTGRDVTPEAFKAVMEKEIEGFGELFRWVSYRNIGTSTMQSRAIGGVAGGTYLFALPGSPGACAR